MRGTIQNEEGGTHPLLERGKRRGNKDGGGTGSKSYAGASRERPSEVEGIPRPRRSHPQQEIIICLYYNMRIHEIELRRAQLRMIVAQLRLQTILGVVQRRHCCIVEHRRVAEEVGLRHLLL